MRLPSPLNRLLTTRRAAVRNRLKHLHEQGCGFQITIRATHPDVDLPPSMKTDNTLTLSFPSYTANALLTTHFHENAFETLMFFDGKRHLCAIPYHAIVRRTIQPITATDHHQRRVAQKKAKFQHATFCWRHTAQGDIMLITFTQETKISYGLLLAAPGMPEREILLTEKSFTQLFNLIRHTLGP